MRRLLILLAVLVVLTAVAGSIAPSPLPSPQPAPSPSPQAAAAAPERRTPTVDAPDVRAVLWAGRASRRVTARVGDQVSITVRDEGLDSVALGDLDIEPVEAGVPAHFDLLVDAPGSYPVVLLDEGRRIGTLVVR